LPEKKSANILGRGATTFIKRTELWWRQDPQKESGEAESEIVGRAERPTLTPVVHKEVG